MSEIINRTFSRLLRISSVQRINKNDAITNFNVNLSRMTETDNIVRVALKSVAFNNNSFNINEYNNIFTINVTTIGELVIVVPVGFYSSTSLRLTLEGLINPLLVPASTTLTFSQSPLTGFINISSNNETFTLYNSTEKNTPMSDVLGFTKIYGASLSEDADNQPSLQGLTTVYLHSLEIAEGNVVDGDVENHDIIGEIPVNVPYGVQQYYEARESELESITYATPRNLDNIGIQLKDIHGNIIKLNGGELTITVRLYYL